MGYANWCENECHYLIASDIDDGGFPPVFGIDCDIEILCWGGDDIDNSTPQAFCKECAAAAHRYRIERRRVEESESERRAKIQTQQREDDERRLRVSREFWHKLSALEFEIQCAKLFRSLGFGAEITPGVNDGGIDILLSKKKSRGAAQCKAWKALCGVEDIRAFYGVIHAERMTFGYFIARTGFTRAASLFLQKIPITEGWTVNDLIDHSQDSDCIK